MKRLGLLALAAVTLAASVTFAGCRGIVGIEDLSVEADSAAPSSPDGAPLDVATDSTVADSSREDAMAASDSSSSDGSLDAGGDATLDSAVTDSAMPPSDSMMPPRDSGHPPNDSAPPPVDSGYANPCLGPDVDGGCPACCHAMYPNGAMEMTTNLFNAGCPCTASGSCYHTACGSGASCSQVPASPPQACGMCLNNLVANAATDCSAAIAACASSPDPGQCTGYYECVSTCPAGLPDGGM
jgi:hypothetical protein